MRFFSTEIVFKRLNALEISTGNKIASYGFEHVSLESGVESLTCTCIIMGDCQYRAIYADPRFCRYFTFKLVLVCAQMNPERQNDILKQPSSELFHEKFPAATLPKFPPTAQNRRFLGTIVDIKIQLRYLENALIVKGVRHFLSVASGNFSRKSSELQLFENIFWHFRFICAKQGAF